MISHYHSWSQALRLEGWLSPQSTTSDLLGWPEHIRYHYIQSPRSRLTSLSRSHTGLYYITKRLLGKSKNRPHSLPSNSLFLLAHAAHLESAVKKELAADRYIGPFSGKHLQELIRPFQSSSLSVIPKPNKSNAFRLIQTFSFSCEPQNNTMSINYTINASRFLCTWGTFAAFSLLA